MNESVTEKALLDAMMKECSDVSTRITTYLTLRERILATGGVLAAAAGTIGIVNNHYWVLVVMPGALAILLTYTNYINSEATALGGYRAALEEKFNDLVGSPAFFWESQLAPRRHRDAVTVGILAIFTILMLAAVTLAVYAGYRLLAEVGFSHPARWWFLGSALAMTIGAFLCLLSTASAERKSHSSAKETSRDFLNLKAAGFTPLEPEELPMTGSEPEDVPPSGILVAERP